MELEEKAMYLYEDILEPEEARKIVLFLKYVVIDRELNLRTIKKELQINDEFIEANINNDSVMLKYLTENELKKFRLKFDLLLGKNKKLIKLIKLVLMENETNLQTIIKRVPIIEPTMKKYASNESELSRYLTKEEINTFVTKINNILDLERKQREDLENRLFATIIDEIFNSRRTYRDICSDNFMCHKVFEKNLNDAQYMEKRFKKGTFEMVKDRIDKNREIRLRKPRDLFLIEDRICVKIARDDIYYLNQYDNRKLNFAAYYLGTGANLDLMQKHFESNTQEILSTLANAKLKEILKPEYYESLHQCLIIEELLLGNNLVKKKEMVAEVVNFLQQNNFDIELAIKYYNIPEPLFNRIIKEIIKLPYASNEIKEILKQTLNIESQTKVK